MHSNIVLIGFMGSGKTTVGRMLSEYLEYDFLDTDCEVEKIAGMAVGQIFENYGESRFRNLEIQVVEAASKNDKIVISTGGGIVLNERNIINLSKKGYIIYLKADVEKIYNNLKDDNTRPLLASVNSYSEKIEKIEKLLSVRENLYDSCSQLCVDTVDKNLEQCFEYIKKSIEAKI